MNEPKMEIAPRTRRFLRELGADEILASDARREGFGRPWGHYPSHAEIDAAIERARLERSLEIKRLLLALCRLARRLPGAASAER